MNAFVIAPTWMGLSSDIVEGLNVLGYTVDFVKDKVSRYDPMNIRADRPLPSTVIERKKLKYWKKFFSAQKYQKKYDLLLVVDGQFFHPYVKDYLKSVNPELYSVNYLFDTIKGVHRFDKNFWCFDYVATFDRSESKKYNISFLPIYWKKNDCAMSLTYSIFGFGTFSEYRYSIYKKLKRIFENNKVASRIELFTPEIKSRSFFKYACFVKKILGQNPGISLHEYDDEMIVHDIIDQTTFQNILANVQVVLDTSPLHQDGMTARFMWALGLGKKIITTNDTIKEYSFYSDSQILVIPTNPNEISEKKVIDFINSPISVDDSKRKLIDDLEIIRWLEDLIHVH